ncbi:hypothetical protein QL886_02900 [Psychrobacter sp. APC 3281]|uniref:hypothetical protein n=1 Tax=Psychrobacter sp. APC 3281 TaxID=3035190 RepID=UPI0025B4D0CF|nr:hypothetical protein [Psychrobacter sp. APC 3281]MDN3446580.1 hypothetical protein [Psychrobacter sp. APC 3281]
MKKEYIWLCDSVLDWSATIESYSYTNEADRLRAYDLWNHADLILTRNANEFNRVDVVSNLKRCLNQRLKFIEHVYSLKKIALSDSPKGYLEYLESLGLVRPYLLKQMMIIRNDIGHNDALPPNIERCRELLDLTWYFLKSTDNFIFWYKNNFTLSYLTDEGEETQYWLNLSINFKLDHSIKINGWIPKVLLSEEEKQGYTLIELKDFVSKETRWGGTEKHMDKLDNDFWVNGSLKPSEKVRLKVVKHCLHANM